MRGIAKACMFAAVRRAISHCEANWAWPGEVAFPPKCKGSAEELGVGFCAASGCFLDFLRFIGFGICGFCTGRLCLWAHRAEVVKLFSNCLQLLFSLRLH